MTEQEILKKLKEDEDYYGDFGKQFLSASSIRSLLYRPTEYGKSEKTLPLLQGRYFHTSILEPEKLHTIPVLGMASRNSKEFKELCKENEYHSYDVLLQKEKDHLDNMVDALLGNLEVYELIHGDNVQYEVPGITMFHKTMFKGKCDILTDQNVFDLKTSGNVHKFRHSCKEYCYDSQAYIYQTLFNKPMVFIVIDKTSFEVKIAECSPEFIESGRHKVKKAVETYNKFFKDDATFDINTYIYKETL